jgi:opacity protein-like surface antigen
MTNPTARQGALVLALLLAPSVAFAQANAAPSERYTLRIEGRYWSPNPEGDVSKGFGDVPGTTLDLQQTLGLLGDSSWNGSLSLQFKQGLKLRASVTPVKFAGDTQAPETFTFGDQTYYYNTHILTSISGYYYTGGLEWDFIKSPSGFLGIVLGASVYDGNSVLLAPETGQRQLQGGVFPIPVLGLVGRTYYGRFSIEGSLSGMTIGDRGTTYDTETGVRFHITDKVAIGGAYRIVKVKGHDSQNRDQVNFKMSGWTAGLEFSL